MPTSSNLADRGIKPPIYRMLWVHGPFDQGMRRIGKRGRAGPLDRGNVRKRFVKAQEAAGVHVRTLPRPAPFIWFDGGEGFFPDYRSKADGPC